MEDMYIKPGKNRGWKEANDDDGVCLSEENETDRRALRFLGNSMFQKWRLNSCLLLQLNRLK